MNNPSVDRLTRVWASLYAPDFHTLPFKQQPALSSELLKTNTAAGRGATAAKLNEDLLLLQSQVASIQTNELYAYMKNVVNLRELKQLAASSFQVYKVLVALYQQDALGTAWMVAPLQAEALAASSVIATAGRSPHIQAFASALEPVLLEFQQQHRQAQDWRTLGFLTTQFNFGNQWLVQKLTPCEQLLFQPYLKFIEEHVAHPWQRVCAAAAAHSSSSPTLAIIEQLLPQTRGIAQATYERLLAACPDHHSRRGWLENPKVAHSCVRDLQMFQAYLWLALLEGNVRVIQQELLDLCLRVLPSVGVKWELIAIWTRTLEEELMARLGAAQQVIVLPYTEGMQQLFSDAREQFDTRLARSIV